MKKSSHHHYSSPDGISTRLRRLVWLNIAVQIAFPLTIAFSPAVAAAKNNPPPVITDQDDLRTRPYTLAKGETVASVAKKYNMTVDELRKLNQLRTFSRGFDHLQAGDELDVPLAARTENKKLLPPITSQNSPPSRTAQSGTPYAQRDGGAAGGMARNMATGAASNEIQQWLSQFGTARVQLDANEKFSLKNSQLELLAPLYDKEKGLAFTQGSIHRTNDRNQANLGVGYRYFDDDWMVGGNLFADYDLSRDHARTGAGVEYWRDFMKLSANGYLRLTNWKDSPDLDDYRERPANGWDVRAQGWLPALPQLGGKLTYEQYYGKNVGLFGSDHLRHNPHAITTGVNYTPIPLVTLNAERRQGESGTNDNRLGIEFNYRLGTDWKNQIDPSAVAAMRTLAGSRYDLVDRNNNIVLEYKKKEVIHLHTRSQVAGWAGEHKSLGVTVTSKYSLAKVEWQAAALLANGGQIVQNGSDYDVILPVWKSGQRNTYTISGEAVDTKGNRSKGSYTLVTVLPPNANQTASQFAPESSTLLANGIDSRELTLTIKDSNGNPVSGLAVTMTSNLSGSTVSAVTDNGNGTYTAVIKGTEAGLATITAQVANGFSMTTSITLLADTASAVLSALTVTANDAVADGVATNAVKATVKDARGNPLAGQSVTFSATNNATVTTASATTDANGEASTTLTSHTIGSSTVTATSNGSSQTVTVSFDADNASATVSTLTVTADNAVADGVASNEVKAMVTDARGNPLEGHAVTFTVDNGVTVTTTTVTTDANGEAHTTLTSHTAGSVTVTATSNGTSKTATVNFKADNTTANLRILDVVLDGAIADGTATNHVVALVTDARGNPLEGQVVTFSASNGARVLTPTVTTDANGEASTTLTSRNIGISQVTATSHGSSKTKAVHFTADTASAVISNLMIMHNGAVADGLAHNEVKAKVTDAHGNLLAGHYAVTFTATNGARVTTSVVTTDSNGEATTTLTNHNVGSSTVTATTNGSNKSVTVEFNADNASAAVHSLTVTGNKAVADGAATNAVKALVMDAHSHPLEGHTVVFSATNGAQVTTTVATTDANGEAHTTLTSHTAGISEVTATSNGTSKMGRVEFLADNSSALVKKLEVVSDDAVADGVTLNEVKATVTDAHGNPLPGHAVAFHASNGATLTTTHVTTNARGEATTTLASRTVGISTVTATSNGSSQLADVHFIVDRASAMISTLEITKNDAVADGLADNEVKATVTDMHGNPLAGHYAVTFSASNGAQVTTTTVTTDANGAASTTIRSHIAGDSVITATTNGHSQTKSVTFHANTATAGVRLLTVVRNGAPANDIAKNEVKAKVTDAHGNPLVGQSVTFTKDAADYFVTIDSTNVTTDNNGEASTTLTSYIDGSTMVTATSNGISQTVAVNFTPRPLITNVAISRDNVPANGTDFSEITATVKDSLGNPMANQWVDFTPDPDTTISASRLLTDAAGKVRIQARSTRAHPAVINMNTNSTGVAAVVNFVPDLATAHVSEMEVENDNALADGIQQIYVRARVTDAHGNWIEGAQVIFGYSDPNVSSSNPTGLTESDGWIATHIASTTPGPVSVDAHHNGTVKSTTITFR